MTEQNTNNTTVREAFNEVIIEGVLLEVRHQEWKSKEGLSIELDVEVGENEIHTIHGMSKYKKKDGTDNGNAKGYQTVINEYKSVAKVGREEADKVQINKGSIGINEYYGQDGMLRSFPQINTNFVNRLKVGEEFNPRAEFSVEIFVKSVTPEFKNEEETGRVKVQAYIPVYGGKVIPMNFTVTEEGSEWVADNYEANSTAKVFGDIVNFKETKRTEEAVAFGKPKEILTSTTVREYLITAGNEPYDEEDVNRFTKEVITNALTEREVHLAGMKAKKEEKPQPKKGEKKGFGTKPSEKKTIDISDDDLPF